MAVETTTQGTLAPMPVPELQPATEYEQAASIALLSIITTCALLWWLRGGWRREP